MRLHLGGMGKGFAIDRAAGILRAHGLRDFMIQAGGDLYVAGQRGDRPWRVAIRDPRGPADRLIAALDLTDGTFSTSGDYSGFSYTTALAITTSWTRIAASPRAVCVASPSSRNVRLTRIRCRPASFVMGAEKGMALVESASEYRCGAGTDHNEVVVSSRLRDRLDPTG